MQVSLEITLYPLDQNYIPPIQDFIDRLNAYDELKVIGNTMSTQVFGDYSRVFEILNKEMQRTHSNTPKAAFVMKVLNGDLSPDA
ncbi:YkoF family thiamine/hydroxymethylpyrimidine-binding protein [Marinicella sp. S1101]|uniref:YkoF family thiamine/hydroxymethylpyrimidine-binding protein n=1 Tax=Marinicella marina TaxID=2996016 RepID=UPI0022608E02|nr:YkoF family thiamine/hydroxymethylpyrimidine-binding protein [Marinicella marina]MCX7552505.1 YkoF family thiamine/hydroxymethylpyrimidine-binding protein [Marinicella marina]MDJ1139381.1 YkoF family thiamine/hydroxymethylpyrimidine-binding protein [Marinicella marina]